MKKIKKGFTLIEILIIIAIIGILVSVALVNLMSARSKAQNNSAFTSFKSLAAPAFMCLSSGGNLTMTGMSGDICNNGSVPNAKWPELVKTSWTYSNFFWCDPRINGESQPGSCGGYASGTCGGDNGLGYFCFGMEKDGKAMWCTIYGCRKSGF